MTMYLWYKINVLILVLNFVLLLAFCISCGSLSHILEKKHVKVMECDTSWHFTNFAPESQNILAFFADIKTILASVYKVCIFIFSAKSWIAEFEQRSKKLLWKSHGKRSCKVCGNPARNMLFRNVFGVCV